YDHGAAAVLALRDVALELEVLHRVVFGLHREPLFVGDEARPVRHRPALEHAVELEPQVIVQAPRSVHLHHEFAAEIGPPRWSGLAVVAELPLALIFGQRGLGRSALRIAARLSLRLRRHADRLICISQSFRARLARAAPPAEESTMR